MSVSALRSSIAWRRISKSRPPGACVAMVFFPPSGVLGRLALFDSELLYSSKEGSASPIWPIFGPFLARRREIQHARFRNHTLQATRGSGGGLSVAPKPATCDALHPKTETLVLPDRKGLGSFGSHSENASRWPLCSPYH